MGFGSIGVSKKISNPRRPLLMEGYTHFQKHGLPRESWPSPPRSSASLGARLKCPWVSAKHSTGPCRSAFMALQIASAGLFGCEADAFGYRVWFTKSSLALCFSIFCKVTQNCAVWYRTFLSLRCKYKCCLPLLIGLNGVQKRKKKIPYINLHPLHFSF